MLLLQFPRLQLRAIPAEIFGSHPPQRRECRDSKARENLRRDLIEHPGPAAKRAGIIVIQFDSISKQLRLLDMHSLYDGSRDLIEAFPNRLIVIVADSLRPGQNLAEHFVRQVATADALKAPAQ